MFIGVGRRGCKCPDCVHPVSAIHLRHNICTPCLCTPAGVSGSFSAFRWAGSAWQNHPPFYGTWQSPSVTDCRDTAWIWITAALSAGAEAGVTGKVHAVHRVWAEKKRRMFPFRVSCAILTDSKWRLVWTIWLHYVVLKNEQQPLGDVKNGPCNVLTPKFWCSWTLNLRRRLQTEG